ncbi:MAG: methionyl-tRNA formyltransferase [Helicobacteraceae bacterium]|nr:methionyl-tRNA formyltransferase [Helicobacteraceae bacterium]
MTHAVFMGTPRYAATILRDLIASGEIDVRLVVTQIDRPAGRKLTLTPPPVKIAALEAGIPCLQPEKVGEIADAIARIKPDLIIAAAYGQMLGDAILKIAPCWNLHASLLPKYRGASPIQAALLNGEVWSGLTLMKMTRTLDAGDLIAFNQIALKGHGAQTLTDTLAQNGARLLLYALRNSDRLRPLPQARCDASYAGRFSRADTIVGFDQSAIYLKRLLAAYGPLTLKSGLKLLDLETTKGRGAEIGAIVEITRKGVVVECGKDAALVKMVQVPSKKAVNAADYINGKRLGVGNILS